MGPKTTWSRFKVNLTQTVTDVLQKPVGRPSSETYRFPFTARAECGFHLFEAAEAQGETRKRSQSSNDSKRLKRLCRLAFDEEGWAPFFCC